MDDSKLSSILEAVNSIKEYGAKRADLERLVTRENLESFKNKILEKLESLHH